MSQLAELVIEGLRHPGQRLYFEYHCWESPQSADAELWYRSHRIVTVLRIVQNDGYDPNNPKVVPTPSLIERYECGCPIQYRIRFDDGFEHDAAEDELLDSPDEYCRPDPPAAPGYQV